MMIIIKPIQKREVLKTVRKRDLMKNLIKITTKVTKNPKNPTVRVKEKTSKFENSWC